ncbi:MAG TPA: glycosyltransferase [Acidimicrobiales bacterium]|nr:glycosyltransferase [Acidimicrobiales bacterium]
MSERRPLRVLRLYHSAVVTAWRRREAALTAENVDVTLVAPRRWNEGGAMVDLEVSSGEDIEAVATFGHHPFRFVSQPWALWQVLRRHRDVDLLDVHEEPAALVTIETMVLARLAGCRAPVVCYSAQNLVKRYPPPFRWFERWVLRRVAAVHTCNDDVAGVLATKGFDGEVVNIGLGVDETVFVPSAPDRTSGTGPLKVGYVGRFTEQKGIFVLVSALANLDRVETVFVGAGPEQTRLEDAIDAHGLGARVTVRGFVDHDDLPELYRGLDVLVVPSIDRPNVREQFGRVIVEAMACGTPVIATDVGAFPVVAADAALIVPDRDAAALSEAIERVRDDPKLRGELRDRGIRRAEDFSWTHIASRQADLYRRVV